MEAPRFLPTTHTCGTLGQMVNVPGGRACLPRGPATQAPGSGEDSHRREGQAQDARGRLGLAGVGERKVSVERERGDRRRRPTQHVIKD